MTTREREEETEGPALKKAKTEDEKKYTGTVALFHDIRGFGFITPDTGDTGDVFVHQLAIVAEDEGHRYLTAGQKVEYTAEYDAEKKKTKALKVWGEGGVALKTKVNPKQQAREAKEAKALKKARGGKKLVEVLDPEVLKQRVQTQIEYYLSDKNLQRDRWMREKVEAGSKGAIAVADLLKCNKLKALTTDEKVLQEAVAASSVLHWSSLPATEGEGEQAAIGRGASVDAVTPLPEYTPPIVIVLTDLVEGMIWKDIRAAYLSTFSAPVSVHTDGNPPFVVLDPEHAGTVALATEQGLKNVEGKQICGVAKATPDQQVALLNFHYESLARQAATKKDRGSRKKGQKRPRQERPIGAVYVGQQKFESTQEVFDKIRVIMGEYKHAAPLLGDDRKFMMDVFGCHPRGQEKLKYTRQVIIKENPNFDSASHCFYLVKKDGSEDDISYIKCVNSLTSEPKPVVEDEAE